MDFDADQPVTLFFDASHRVTYPNLTALINNYGYAWLKENVGKNHRTFSHRQWESSHQAQPFSYYQSVYVYTPAIVRDIGGEPLTLARLAAHYYALCEQRRARQNKGYDSLFKAIRYQYWKKGQPVPYTGARIRGRYNWFRRPRTTHSKRWSQQMCEFEPPVRGRRRAKQLPCAWCDQVRTDKRNRNWKRYRKTQWKSK